MAMTNSSALSDGEIPLHTMNNLPGQPEVLPKEENPPNQGKVTEVENTGFDDGDAIQDLTPLTYVDFMPRCLETGYVQGKIPNFAEFRTVVEQSNQWLESMPQYSVLKCETITRRLNSSTFEVDNDAVVHHVSSRGSNVYLMGLRLWLVPKEDPDTPIQKLSYLSVVPEGSDNVYDLIRSVITGQTGFRTNTSGIFSCFNPVTKTVEKMNRHFKLNPIAGKILNADTFRLFIQDTEADHSLKPNPEVTCWQECGKNNRIFLYALRIFFVLGDPAFETLGIQDIQPDFVQIQEGLGYKTRYGTYGSTVEKAKNWLKKQQDIAVLNIQSVDIKCDRQITGQTSFSSQVSGYSELSLEDSSQFVKVLRIFYTKQEKVAEVSEETDVLSTRLFVPVRKGQTGLDFEKFSKTMQRVIAWLNITKTPVLSVESVEYPVTPGSWGTGVMDDKVDSILSHANGRYALTCIRLHFQKEFKEPSAEELPPTQEDEAGWMCIVS